MQSMQGHLSWTRLLWNLGRFAPSQAVLTLAVNSCVLLFTAGIFWVLWGNAGRLLGQKKPYSSVSCRKINLVPVRSNALQAFFLVKQQDCGELLPLALAKGRKSPWDQMLYTIPHLTSHWAVLPRCLGWGMSSIPWQSFMIYPPCPSIWVHPKTRLPVVVSIHSLEKCCFQASPPPIMNAAVDLNPKTKCYKGGKGREDASLQ